MPSPSLTSVHDPRVGSEAGDVMFDGVIPLGRALRPLGLFGPSTPTWPAGGRREPVAANWLTKGFARTGELANQPPAGFVFALPTKTHGVPVRAFAH